MPPEVFIKKHKLKGHQVDIFSAGVVLFTMASGIHPFNNNMAEPNEFEYYHYMNTALGSEFTYPKHVKMTSKNRVL